MSFEIERGFGLGEDGDVAARGSSPDSIWQEFVRVVGGKVDTPPASAAQVAELLNQSPLSPTGLYDQLITLTTSAVGQEPGDNLQRVSELVRLMEATRLSSAISAAKNATERTWLLQTLAGLIAVPAVLALVRAAAYAYAQPLSPVMTNLLNKSARVARTEGARPAQDSAFRDFVRSIFEAWALRSVDTASTGYESMFASASNEQQEQAVHPAVTPEPERVIALSFETGAVGRVVWNALAKLSRTDRGMRQTIEMLKSAPETSKAADMVAQQFATPNRLAMLLREDSVDMAAVDVLLARMLESAGPTLLDALIDAQTSARRRDLLQRMTAIGPAICDLAVERLQKETRPHALRDLLAVLRKAYCDVTNVALEKFVAHEDVRVRKEAMWLLFDDPIQRDRAVLVALRDPDVSMLKVGLKAARDGLPEAAVPILAKRVVDPKFPSEFRTSVLQLLARSQSVLALEVLLSFTFGKTLLGKPTLAAKSPEMLISLSGLARTWANERRVADVLARARSSTDPEILDALTASQSRIVLPDLDEPDDE